MTALTTNNERENQIVNDIVEILTSGEPLPNEIQRIGGALAHKLYSPENTQRILEALSTGIQKILDYFEDPIGRVASNAYFKGILLSDLLEVIEDLTRYGMELPTNPDLKTLKEKADGFRHQLDGYTYTPAPGTDPFGMRTVVKIPFRVAQLKALASNLESYHPRVNTKLESLSATDQPNTDDLSLVIIWKKIYGMFIHEYNKFLSDCNITSDTFGLTTDQVNSFRKLEARLSRNTWYQELYV